MLKLMIAATRVTIEPETQAGMAAAISAWYAVSMSTMKTAVKRARRMMLYDNQGFTQ